MTARVSLAQATALMGQMGPLRNAVWALSNLMRGKPQPSAAHVTSVLPTLGASTRTRTYSLPFPVLVSSSLLFSPLLSSSLLFSPLLSSSLLFSPLLSSSLLLPSC
jgi:hypothetical protein